MSAYGAIVRSNAPSNPLASTVWDCKSKPKDVTPRQLIIHHLTLDAAGSLPGLVDHLRAVFTLDIEAGRTYPQETIDGVGVFEAYFFAADVFVAILEDDNVAPVSEGETNIGIEESRKGRNWEDCVVGFYYVKPNYPGRSSHICNAGFVVCPNHRGGGYGSVLGRSYLHYGPKLGYRASVFNLVYVNNTASVRSAPRPPSSFSPTGAYFTSANHTNSSPDRIWESLDFTKAGLIPKAGRLKRADGQGEEYVDAWVFYKSFVDE